MHGQYRKLDLSKVLTLKRQGLSNQQIAQRFGVTHGTVYYFLRRVGDDQPARETGRTA
ncbi:MAG: helix-turn-helix domain-containing protein [Pseudomonadota bacterium]